MKIPQNIVKLENMISSNHFAKFKKKFSVAEEGDEEKVLLKKLARAWVGIFGVVIFTILFLQLLGPKFFSIFGLLSLDKYRKEQTAKIQTVQPKFGDLPKATNKRSININGYTESGSLIKIYVNGPEKGTTTADSSGNFTFNDIGLTEGSNLIFVKAEAPNKVESERSETVYIKYDSRPPQVVISEPKNDVFIESVDTRVTVKGLVNEADSTVRVNDALSILSSTGEYQSLVNLKEGDNKIVVIAKDAAGNEASASIKIKFDKR